jgi:hypothetical protein
MECQVRVLSSSELEDACHLVLLFDKLPSKPIAPASLHSSSDSPVEFELHKVLNMARTEATFAMYNHKGPLPKPGKTYIFRSWWAPYQLELAKDKTRVWRREKFEPSDELAFRLVDGGTMGRKKLEGEKIPPGGFVVPGGWEHEHCKLCWATIADIQGFQNSGYTDGEDWLCEACYEKYIASGLGQKLG